MKAMELELERQKPDLTTVSEHELYRMYDHAWYRNWFKIGTLDLEPHPYDSDKTIVDWIIDIQEEMKRRGYFD